MLKLGLCLIFVASSFVLVESQVTGLEQARFIRQRRIYEIIERIYIARSIRRRYFLRCRLQGGFGCNGQGPPPFVTPICNITDELINRFIASNVRFSSTIFADVSKDLDYVSFVLCPFGMFFPMAPYIIYTRPGPSRDQIVHFFNVSTTEEIRCICSYYLTLFGYQQPYGIDSLEFAKDFVNSDYPLTTNYINDTAFIMGYPAESLSFSNTSAAADTINAWIYQATRSRVPTIVSADTLSTNEEICKPHAVTFKGTLGFDPKLTTIQPFYVNASKTIYRPMMYRKEDMLYTEDTNLGAQVVRFSYVNPNLTYILILPFDPNGYKAVVEKLRNPDVLRASLKQLELVRVELLLPKGYLNFTIDLIPYFKKQNVTNVFSASTAQLTDISTAGDRGLYISDFKQLLSYSIDEAGPYKDVTPDPPVKIVHANRTFIFIITLIDDPKFLGVDCGFS